MRWLVVAVVVVLVAGCGSSKKTAEDPIGSEMAKVRTTCVDGIACDHDSRSYTKCTHVSLGYRACTTFFASSEKPTALYRRADNGWAKVRGRLPGRVGWWRRVLAAPGGRTLLAQWSGECEVQSTYLVSVVDGTSTPLFGGHSSAGLGWTVNGLARVLLTEEIWRGNTRVRRAGIYRVDPGTLAIRRERAMPRHSGC